MAQPGHDTLEATDDDPLFRSAALAELGEDSYTVHRLKHATPEHLHLTTRRCFIGPIPEGWLKSHRRDWYKQRLNIHYSSRSATFSAAANTSRHRRVTGIDGPNPSKDHLQSFPQPSSLANEEHGNENGEILEVSTGEASTENSPDIHTGTGASKTDGKTEQPKQYSEESSNAFPSSSDAIGDKKLDMVLKPQNHRNSRRAPTERLKKASNDKHRTSSKLQSRPKASRKPSGADSFVTAHEVPEAMSSANSSSDEEGQGKRSVDSARGIGFSESANRSSIIGSESVGGSSTAPLLKQRPAESRQATSDLPSERSGILNRKRLTELQHENNIPQYDNQPPSKLDEGRGTKDPRTVSGLVRFNLPHQTDNHPEDQMLKVRLAQFRRRDTLKKLHKGKFRDGEILKVEKMLVRVEFTSHEMQDEFDENDSQRIESRTLEKWREFMVVCRESASDKNDFVLQMYKSRVIRAIEKSSQKQRSAHQVLLNKKTRVNIFSSLDKTIVLWEPYKQGHRIFIMKPRSGTSSMEWYTFLRNLLGWDRPATLQVNVPDLDVSLLLDQPFETLESIQDLEQAAQGDKEALAKAVEEEKAVAGKIVSRCVKMLENSPEWSSVIDAWAASPFLESEDARSPTMTTRSKNGTANASLNSSSQHRHDSKISATPYNPVGLAWKRYDRLEWVHGPNERNMYGTIGMEKSHDLELRPKQHYPTSVIIGNTGSSTIEPVPIEGFLIRLTSQRGTEQRMGRRFSKRLYFSSHNQYLVFNRPAHADPPRPPELKRWSGSKVPTTNEISGQMPLIYSVNPYPMRNGQIEWLNDGSVRQLKDIVGLDQNAYDENERKVNILLQCEGVIDLCNVMKIRKARMGYSVPNTSLDGDQEGDSGPDSEDGTGNESNPTSSGEGVFELVMNNDLVIKLQAYDKITRREWIQRLRTLVSYWKYRSASDIALYKAVRRRNVEYLKIDEDMEATIGQFARKWEVRQSFASTELYNMCGISCCRAIQMSGHLYRKPRLRASFERCQVILSHGQLLVFEALLRQSNGKIIPHTHYQRTNSLNLSDCYIYSGLITSEDLLNSSAGNATDRAYLGSHHGIPRMYLEDGWSSTDEDSMTCFVVWHGQRKSWFRTVRSQDSEQGAGAKFKLVPMLGKEGRAIVFKTRSRAERDHWVMSIAMEIERTAKKEDIKIVG